MTPAAKRFCASASSALARSGAGAPTPATAAPAMAVAAAAAVKAATSTPRPHRAVATGASAAASTGALRPSYGLWFEGQEVPALGNATLPIENPATGEAVSETALGDEDDVDRAVASAKACHESGAWRRLGARGRGRVLRGAAALLRERLELLAEVETLCTGRPRREYMAQLGRVPEWLEYHASVAECSEGSVPPFADAEDHVCIVRRRPLGVCALITPWNHPLLIATKKVAVALATGNCVVVKPPELAPASVIELARCLSEAGAPPGAINVVTGLGPVAGAALAAHADVVKVDFTGGTAAGRAIGGLIGPQVKHYCAELGGNAPVLIFADADIDEAVNGAAFGAFVASGQTCVSAKRLLVEKDCFEEFMSKFVAKTRGLTLGDPMDLSTQVGPLASLRALETVDVQVKEAIAAGAVPLVGGGKPAFPSTGHFFQPTVLGEVTPDMQCVQEEIFGPVVTVQAFGSEQEALTLANNNKYALGAAVWTSSVKRAHRVMDGLRAGVMWCNAHHRNSPDAPWGGYGASGIGRENGLEAHREYTAPATMVIKTSDAKEDWFAGVAQARYG